jgi:hypothetical protein
MKSKVDPAFWRRFNALPLEVQQLARNAFALWLKAPLSGDVDAAIAAQRRFQPAERPARCRQHPPCRHPERDCQRERGAY